MLGAVKGFVRDRPAIRAATLRTLALVRSLAHAPPGLYALCYHRIADPEGFRAQLAHLGRHGRFVDADAAADLVREGRAGAGRHYLVTLDDGYADAVGAALPVLRTLGVPAILFVVSQWVNAPPATPPGPYATDADLRAWLAAGMAIGSHSATHAHFSRLDAEGTARELAGSKAALEALVGGPVRHFACPWGVAGADYVIERDPALAAACGYETFYTTRRGRATGAADLLAMPRHVLEPEWPLWQLDGLMGGRRA